MKNLKLLGLAIVLLVLGVGDLAFADLVNIGRVDLHGTGFGHETYIMSMHAVGNNRKTGQEQGCDGWNGSAVVLGSSECAGAVVSNDETVPAYTGGDEMNPAHFPHNQTPLLSSLGVTNANQIVIIFNPDQTGPDHPITLEDLTITIWDNSTGNMVWQSGDLSDDAEFFASTDSGIGKSGIAYDLDATQVASLNAVLSPSTQRIGLSAHVSGANGGPDAFFVATQGAAVPEPAALLLFGSGLLGLGGIVRRRLKK